MKILLIFLIVSILASGCATGKIIIPEIQNDYEVEAGFEIVWQAVVESITDNSMSIEVIEKESGIITTGFIKFFNNYNERAELDRLAEKPDYNFLAKWTEGKLKYNIFVKSISDTTTRMKITSQMEAFEGGISHEWVVVYSRGIIEDDLFDLIKAKI